MDIDVKSLRKKMIGLRGTDNYDQHSFLKQMHSGSIVGLGS
jgi:hypothetical protein